MSHNILSITLSILALPLLAACTANLPGNFSPPPIVGAPTTDRAISVSDAPAIARFSNSEKQCLARAMYFESNRSSASGMLAVGTVVMNRVASSQFDNSICAVVGAPNQFAAGILTSPMKEGGPLALANSVAERILNGERHPGVRSAKFFHQAGLTFPYDNMTYVTEAGGNAFYIKG